jgi:hypothetical protein
VHRHAHNDRRVVRAAAATVEPGLIFALLMRTALQLRCTRRARAPHMNNHRIDAAAGERTIARGGGECQGDTAEHSRRARRRWGRCASITCNAVDRNRYVQNTGRRKGNCRVHLELGMRMPGSWTDHPQDEVRDIRQELAITSRRQNVFLYMGCLRSDSSSSRKPLVGVDAPKRRRRSANKSR